MKIDVSVEHKHFCGIIATNYQKKKTNWRFLKNLNELHILNKSPPVWFLGGVVLK